MRTKAFSLVFGLVSYLSLPAHVLAAPIVPGTGGKFFEIPNILGFTNISQLIDNLIQLAFFVAGIALFVNFLVGGFQWINAGGDAKAMQAARGRITNSLIGLIIVVAAVAITRIIENVLGISITGGFKFF